MSSSTEDNSKCAMGKVCVPCSTMDSSHLLSNDEVQKQLSESLPLWSMRTEEEGGKTHIFRKFTARNFQSALDCLNAMGTVAEREQHHPDFHLTNYRDVEITMWTHSIGGITVNDLALANVLDNEVKINYSPKWLKAHPEARNTSTN